MLPKSERVIATPIEGLIADATEIADPRQRDAYQAVEELPHTCPPQRDHHANRHSFTQLEIGNRFACSREHRLLPCYLHQFFNRGVEDFHIVASLAQRHVDGDLLQSWHSPAIFNL